MSHTGGRRATEELRSPGSVGSGGYPKQKPGDVGDQEPGGGQGGDNGVGGVGRVPGWVLYQRRQGRSCLQKKEWPVVLRAPGRSRSIHDRPLTRCPHSHGGRAPENCLVRGG